ncbi:MAG: SDR family NAD(P)-dependent oxidoreductase, partial [Microbacterium sp.]
MSRTPQVPDGWYAGKVAVVTGGSSGIGAALVAALRAHGAVVVATDLSPGPGDVALDVTDADAVQALVDRVVAEHGRIDLLFNNAGITFIGETQD